MADAAEPEPIEDYMTIPEAATATGAAQRTIRSWIAREKLTALPSPKGRMVSVAAVRQLQQESPRATADAARTQSTAVAAAVPSALEEAGRLIAGNQEQLLRAVQDLREQLADDVARRVVAELVEKGWSPPPNELAGDPSDEKAEEAPAPAHRSWWVRIFGDH